MSPRIGIKASCLIPIQTLKNEVSLNARMHVRTSRDVSGFLIYWLYIQIVVSLSCTTYGPVSVDAFTLQNFPIIVYHILLCIL